jgi:hypothetical protein
VQILFTMPMFKWEDEYPVQPHFATYWIFTVPITAAFVIAFSLWFMAILLNDKKEDRERAKKKQEREKKREERELALKNYREDVVTGPTDVDANTASLPAAAARVRENPYAPVL